MKRHNIQHDKEAKPNPRTEAEYDIPPINTTPEELAKSMFRNANRKLAEKKSNK